MEAKSTEMSAAASAELAVTIREELARRRWSRQGLADAAGISLSTLEKALNGGRAFTLATVVRLEAALGKSLRSVAPSSVSVSPSGSAPAWLGGYTADAVKWLEGDYLTLRPSLELPGVIFAYRTIIAWDGEQGLLAFHEAQRQDAPFAQRGVVSVPNKSGQIYLHTNEDGQLRLAILGRPLIGGEMYGLLSTLQAGPGSQLLPVSVPLALVPFAATAGVLGRVTASDDSYALYRVHLDRVVAGGFARLVMP